MSTRWIIERRDGQFEDCGYDTLEVLPNGALRLYSGSMFSPGERYYIAAGEWLTVIEERDA